METPYIKAWRTWTESKEGKQCLDIFTLESSKSQENFEKFLTNRLKRAFAAAWIARGETE